eukprot:1158594-Pelagomonas_calceolata.AAC.6
MLYNGRLHTINSWAFKTQGQGFWGQHRHRLAGKEGEQTLHHYKPHWLEDLTHEVPEGLWCHNSSQDLANEQIPILSLKIPSTWRKGFQLLDPDIVNMFEGCTQKKCQTQYAKVRAASAALGSRLATVV